LRFLWSFFNFTAEAFSSMAHLNRKLDSAKRPSTAPQPKPQLSMLVKHDNKRKAILSTQRATAVASIDTHTHVPSLARAPNMCARGGRVWVSQHLMSTYMYIDTFTSWESFSCFGIFPVQECVFARECPVFPFLLIKEEYFLFAYILRALFVCGFVLALESGR